MQIGEMTLHYLTMMLKLQTAVHALTTIGERYFTSNFIQKKPTNKNRTAYLTALLLSLTRLCLSILLTQMHILTADLYTGTKATIKMPFKAWRQQNLIPIQRHLFIL